MIIPGHTKQPLLGVKRKLWRQDDEHAILKDEKYKSLRDKILLRDNYTCHFCNFRFDEFQEIHHVDDDHGNNDPENLITTCNLCHAVHHLGMTAIRGAGFMAYIPEMSQTDINGIVRILFMQLHNNKEKTELVNALHSLYSIFENRGRAVLNKVLKSESVDFSQPMILAQFLSSCDESMYENRADILSGLVLVPNRKAFTDRQLERYFTKNGSNIHQAESYKRLYEQLKTVARDLTS